MSIGLFQHSQLGLVRRYILTNRYILQCEYDFKVIQSWFLSYEQLHQVYLKDKKIEYIFLPEEIFSENEEESYDSNTAIKLNPSSKKIHVIYDHFVLTLGDELRQRIRNNETFGLQQLWYILFMLIKAAQELTELHAVFKPDDVLIIHPQTVLLSEQGVIKLLSWHSTPRKMLRQPLFQTPTDQNQPLFKKMLLSATFSIGRIMASLLLLKELNHYQNDGHFNLLNFNNDLANVKQRYGILGNIVSGMLQGIPDQRILIHEISALLSPYEECLASLEGFRLDRSLCLQSMNQTFIGQN